MYTEEKPDFGCTCTSANGLDRQIRYGSQTSVSDRKPGKRHQLDQRTNLKGNASTDNKASRGKAPGSQQEKKENTEIKRKKVAFFFFL